MVWIDEYFIYPVGHLGIHYCIHNMTYTHYKNTETFLNCVQCRVESCNILYLCVYTLEVVHGNKIEGERNRKSAVGQPDSVLVQPGASVQSREASQNDRLS